MAVRDAAATNRSGGYGGGRARWLSRRVLMMVVCGGLAVVVILGCAFSATLGGAAVLPPTNDDELRGATSAPHRRDAALPAGPTPPVLALQTAQQPTQPPPVILAIYARQLPSAPRRVGRAAPPLAGPSRRKVAGQQVSAKTGLPPAPTAMSVAEASAILASPRCASFSLDAFRASLAVTAGGSHPRFVSAEPMRGGYGFTNQLLVYAALTHFALVTKRRVIFPDSRFPFERLVSVNRSRFVPQVSILSSACEAAAVEVQFSVLRMKDSRFYLVRKALSRVRVAHDPNDAMRRYGAITTRTEPHLRLWDMYGRWPYGADTMPSWMTFPWFLCSVRFSDRIEQLAERLYLRFAEAAATYHAYYKPNGTVDGLVSKSELRQRHIEYVGNATHARYVAVHLRMEPQDMHSMGRSWSNPEQVGDFMVSTMFPLAFRFKTRTIVICSGKLHGKVERSIQVIAEHHGFQILRKTDFGEAPFGRDEHIASGEHSGYKLVPTSTEGAATDLLLIERAVAVVATSFSSFTSGVYGRRCCEAFTEIGAANYSAAESPFAAFGGGPQRGNIFLYEVYRDGSITEAAEYPCGHQLGDYVKGRTVPAAPAGKELFTMGFNRSNPLFAAHPERNDGPIIFPPNVEVFELPSQRAKAAIPGAAAAAPGDPTRRGRKARQNPALLLASNGSMLRLDRSTGV